VDPLPERVRLVAAPGALRLALPRAPVAHDQPLAVLVGLLGEPLDVVGDPASNAVAIIRRAPSRASSSSVT
jgi:hypothetical protein